MNIRTSSLLLLGALSALPSAQAADPVANARGTLDQWVETRRLISREKADWQVEKTILTETQTLLANELKRLTASLAELQDSATAADDERAALTTDKDALNAGANVIATHVATLEARVKAILPTLPPPLVERIQPLLRRLPDDSATTKLSLGERVQNIVGILSQADKFNGTVTFTSETRQVDDGREVEVRTLYWGLAMACYVDASGRYAGIGHPGKDGWEWPRLDDAGPRIQELLAVYEGTTDIRFVEMPARLR